MAEEVQGNVAVYAKVFPGGWLVAKSQFPVTTALSGIQTIGPVVTVGRRYKLECTRAAEWVSRCGRVSPG